jgi:hypothetical protein
VLLGTVQHWFGWSSAAVPLTVALVAAACVAVVALALRGTKGTDRAEILLALADVIRALWFGRGTKGKR